MSVIGEVDSVWRYPVKGMRGEELPEIFAGFSGVYGDRLFAFKSSTAPAAFPYFTARDRHDMLLYRPRFRDPEKARMPPNLAEAMALSPLLNPIAADAGNLSLDVETPTGELLAIDDPVLLRELAEGIGSGHLLSLVRSDRAMTDCRPISLFSLQTARQLGEEVGTFLDRRRFRANVYLDLRDAKGFWENELVGGQLRVGAKVVISIIERDPRCKMITLDPDTAMPNPEVLRRVTQAHDRTAGVYGAVLAEGVIRAGDPVEILS
jgi:uncharacterized protein YcbX